MEWIKTEIEFASTFSYRMPDTSSQFAIPMLLPGPSTVKLGLVATSILQSGKISEGESIFELLKRAETKFSLPEKVAVFRPLIKRLKAKRANRGFEQTFGARGYVLYSGPITLYLGIPNASEGVHKKVFNTVSNLRRLGTSDSLLTVFDITREAPSDPSKIIEPLKNLERMEKSGLIQKVKDISHDAQFNDVNPFSGLRAKKKKPFVERFYIIPVKTLKEGGNWVLYERLNESYR